jgi:hypothetical protein
MDENQAWRTERVLRIAEEDFRRRVIEQAPKIRADVELMAQMIRELVNLEREKRGLDNPRGTLELRPNPEKRSPTDSDLIGSGSVRGHFYRASGWLSKTEKLRILLLPQRSK